MIRITTGSFCIGATKYQRGQQFDAREEVLLGMVACKPEIAKEVLGDSIAVWVAPDSSTVQDWWDEQHPAFRKKVQDYFDEEINPLGTDIYGGDAGGYYCAYETLPRDARAYLAHEYAGWGCDAKDKALFYCAAFMFYDAAKGSLKLRVPIGGNRV